MASATTLWFDDFYRKYKGQFLAKSGGHKYFFRIFTDFQSQTETQKRQKSTFEISKIHIKNGWIYGQKCFWGQG